MNGSISREPDYVSWTAGGSVTQDLSDKNATLFLGFNHGYDIGGRTGTPFSVFSRTLDTEAVKGGLTLVLDRKTIASFVGGHDLRERRPVQAVPLHPPLRAGDERAERSVGRPGHAPAGRGPPARTAAALAPEVRGVLPDGAPLRHDEHAAARRAAVRRQLRRSWRARLTHATSSTWGRASRWARTLASTRRHRSTSGSARTRSARDSRSPPCAPEIRELGPLVGLTTGFAVRYKLGPPGERLRWVLGWDVNVTETHYLDDIYITDRLSTVTGLSLEANL